MKKSILTAALVGSMSLYASYGVFAQAGEVDTIMASVEQGCSGAGGDCAAAVRAALNAMPSLTPAQAADLTSKLFAYQQTVAPAVAAVINQVVAAVADPQVQAAFNVAEAQPAAGPAGSAQ